jgi:hypothetical protein
MQVHQRSLIVRPWLRPRYVVCCELLRLHAEGAGNRVDSLQRFDSFRHRSRGEGLSRGAKC